MNIVVDSSLIIDGLRGGPQWDKFVIQAENDDAILYMPTIVIFELYCGQSSKKLDFWTSIYKVTRFFNEIELSKPIAQRAGELFRDGVRGIDLADYVVAASALGSGASVATLNKKHFEAVPNIQLYSW